MKIIGITGSLREASLNTWLLNAAEKLMPSGTTFQLVKINTIPLYNEDIGNDNKPDAVASFLNDITNADALLFAAPEYNHGIPGGLKNAIDWASRPAFQSPLKLKPCGILTASKSPVGGARAQADLKNILSSTLSPVFSSVEFLVPSAHEKFDDKGLLIDEVSTRRLKRYVDGFVSWANKNRMD